MEQLTGAFPYRFEAVGPHEARMVEAERRGFFGQWTKPRGRLGEVRCSAVQEPAATAVVITATPGRATESRALQLVHLLTSGRQDPRTIYRQRLIPAGPVTLVASWAGMPYRMYAEPEYSSPRVGAITTATPMETVDGTPGHWRRIRLQDGTEGFVEQDQLVAAPAVATRRAQAEAAKYV